MTFTMNPLLGGEGATEGPGSGATAARSVGNGRGLRGEAERIKKEVPGS